MHEVALSLKPRAAESCIVTHSRSAARPSTRVDPHVASNSESVFFAASRAFFPPTLMKGPCLSRELDEKLQELSGIRSKVAH